MFELFQTYFKTTQNSHIGIEESGFIFQKLSHKMILSKG